MAVLVAVLAACSPQVPVTSQTAAPVAVPTLQPDDLVDLTLYFRSGNGADAHLEPVVREVPVTSDLPQRAAELLVAGPLDDDGDGLRPALPPSTRIHSVRMDGDTAVVDLSADVLTDAVGFGATPETEVLALGALANTLTEFPSIARVRVLVEGRDRGQAAGREITRFWGHWGLPDILVRDESLIGPPREGDGIPDLSAYVTEPQQLGARDVDAVRVAGIRLRERTTYVRLILELADGADPALPADGVPVTSVRPRADGLILEVRRVVGLTEDAGELPEHTGVIEGLALATDALPGTLRLSLEVAEGASYQLQALASPPRIVLDLKR